MDFFSLDKVYQRSQIEMPAREIQIEDKILTLWHDLYQTEKALVWRDCIIKN